MKIAMVCGIPFLGGVGAFAYNYFRHLPDKDFRMDFVLQDMPSQEVVREIERRGGRVILFPPYRKVFALLGRLYRIFRDGRYDIVHANANTLNFFVLFAARLAGVPVRLSHAHSASNPKDRKRHIAKLALKPLSRLFQTHCLACSELAGRFQFGDRKWEGGSVRLVKNAIELDRFTFDENARLELRAEFGLNGKFVIGHVGRFSPQKNHQGLIDIFSEIARTRDDVVLVLIGDGPLRKQIEDAVRTKGLADSVIFAGERRDTYRFYSLFDAFCFPSLYEGLGMVLVEAQMNGLPCVASTEVPRAAGMTDQVEFLPLDAPRAQWADRLLAAKRGDSMRCREQLAAAGYDITREAENLAAFYRDACPQCRSEMSYSNAKEVGPC